ncbi:MAG: GNAT family N-acetyltransferase [Oscillospiraceae bacterium]
MSKISWVEWVENKGTCLLETERLILRKFVIEDAQLMYDNWTSRPEVSKTLSWFPAQNVEETKELLREWIDCYKNDDFYIWAIIRKETSEPIGSISATVKNKKFDEIEMGYAISDLYWGKGIATEALKAVIHFMLIDCKYNRVYAMHGTDNPASGRVMDKAGLQYEGVLRKVGKDKYGKYYDMSIHAITRDDLIEAEKKQN